ncbi:MAG: hypothetical protein M3680_01175 [Myxococcota bacterium]|nr:hypothetical protein [Myxococcota bacterium]
MKKTLLACVLVACRSADAPTHPPATPVAPTVPRDGRLHSTETPEPGGTHLQITGHSVPLEDVRLPAWMSVPIGGTVDIAVDLHVPSDGGVADYRRATGTGTVRCVAGCMLGGESAGGGTRDDVEALLLPRISVDRFEARAVFAEGRAEITHWSLESKDARIEVSGQLQLARTLLESEAMFCGRFRSTGSTRASNEALAPTMSQVGIALDANGMWNIKFAGRLDALGLVDFGCDGEAAPPPDRSASEVAAGASVSDLDRPDAIKQISDTSFQIDRAAFDQALANPMVFAKSARFVPAVKDGKPNGFKLYAIRPGSVLARLGLVNGDALHAINGMRLDGADQALEAYTRLRQASSWKLEITRGTRTRTLTYSIK